MERKEINQALNYESFDNVYSALCAIYGDDIVEDIYVLPNVPKVKEALRDLHFNIEQKGDKWMIVKLSNDVKKNFELCDYLDNHQLLPFWGNEYNFSDFIN